jgi:hypothetical protein
MKTPMKKILREHRLTLLGIVGVALVIVTTLAAWAQTVPVLKITPVGTNQYSVTISNNIGALDYDLEWTPALGNANFLWTYAAIGVPGGTNFLLNANGYPATFYRAILDTNTPPLWQSSNPNIPNSPILQVFIYNPTNGAVLH